jgi:hypothetical protein
MLDKDCAAIVNGGPDIMEVGKLTVDDIETVEIYDRRAPPQTTRKQPITAIPMRNAEGAGMANRLKPCTLVYVWLR